MPFFFAFGFLAFSLLGFLASWLSGFSASRLFGFWASCLFGFLASWLLGFLASWLFGFLASASGLLGFSAFCWLFASSAFPVPLRQVVFWLLRLFAGLCGFWRLWLFASFGLFGYWFWDLASRIISITTTVFESSLLRTSWGGNSPRGREE